jgi:hypothetical protein
MLGDIQLVSGSFSRPVSDIVSFLAPQSTYSRASNGRDCPWRRDAYDRTLSCPDLARAINDFLSSDVEFISNDDLPVQLCA